MLVTITKGDRVRQCHKDDIAVFVADGYAVAAAPKKTRKKAVKAEADAQGVTVHEAE